MPAMPAPDEFALDPKLIRRRCEASAATARGVDFLGQELAQRMAERLEAIRLSPNRILDLGCGLGADLPLLAERYPEAERIGLDFALPRLRLAAPQTSGLSRLIARKAAPHWICAEADALPLASASVQLIWSNLLLPSLSDPLPALRECHRVLESEGLFIFASLGPDSLKELRAALPDRFGTRVHRFADMHDLGDALLEAGFSAPVLDRETLTLSYAKPEDLFRDLRAGGVTNASRNRPRGLSGKQAWREACDRLLETDDNGRFPVTLELVFGHAWKPATCVREDGRSVVRLLPRARGA